MRLAPLLALLLAAPALNAQTSIPDPTPAAAYYPLAVGNQWEYRDYDPTPLSERYPFERVTVTGQTTIGGTPYFTVVTQQFRPWYENTWDVRQSDALIRFDAPAAMVRRAVNGGTREVDVLACRLDLPIPAGGASVPCGTAPDPSYSVFPGTAVTIGADVVVRSVRSQTWLYFTTRFAADIGIIGIAGCEISCTDQRLEYARVGSMTFGEPIPGLPAFVAGEAGAAPAAALALLAAPNPTDGALRLALTLPAAQTVRLEAFDALGRRMWQQSAALGSGAQSVPVDASAWAPGLYLVRASAGSASASARVVRR